MRPKGYGVHIHIFDIAIFYITSTEGVCNIMKYLLTVVIAGPLKSSDKPQHYQGKVLIKFYIHNYPS